MSVICHIQFQWKFTEHFRNRIKRIWSVRKNMAVIVKIFRKKKFADTFLLLCVNLTTHCQNLEAIEQFSMSLSFYSVPFKWKNWFEKTALKMSIRQVIFTSGQNLKPPFLCQYLIFLRIFFLDESSCLDLYINLKIKISTKWLVWRCTVTLIISPCTIWSHGTE